MSDNASHYELWYTRRGGITRGPFPGGLISDFLLLGRLTEKDEISQDGHTWIPLSEQPHLVPEVLRNAVTDEDGERLRVARMRADERLRERRADGPVPPAIADLRHGDRRHGEASEVLQFRTLRAQARPGLLVTLQRPTYRYPIAIAVVLLVGMGVSYLWHGSDYSLETTRDCQAPAAPAVNWNHCDKTGVALARASLTGAVLNNARFTGAALYAAALDGADLGFAELSGADLSHSSLKLANLRGAVLRGANLAHADLDGADLGYADLRGANLGGARLDHARLGRALWVDGRTCAGDSVNTCR